MKYKIQPYKWQLRAIEMANKEKNLALLADMGTGKTGALINILRARYIEAKRVKRTLILSPLVTLYNWKNEFMKHSYIKKEDITVLVGTTPKKLRAFHKH